MDFKRLFLSAVMGIAVTTGLLAQQTNITGHVLDESDHSPISNANVILMNPDSSMISGTNTNSEGMFEFKLQTAGKKMLSVSFIGYETTVVIFDTFYDGMEFAIKLKPSAITLGEVTIQARSVIHKADRTLVLPSETQIKNSTGGIDLLQKMQLPRIFIDPISEMITTTGNGEVQLRLNGVQVTQTEISALLPADIQRIEYHEAPGARYGKAAAVIDYITRKTESGGNVKVQLGAHLDGKVSDDRLSFQYNRGKSEFSANADYNYHHTDGYRNYTERFVFPDHELQRMETGELTKFVKRTLNTTVHYSLTEQDKYFFNARLRYSFYKFPFSENDRISTVFTGSDTLNVYDHASETNQIPALDLYSQFNLKNNQLLIFNVVGTQIKSDYSRIYSEENKMENILLSDFLSEISGNKYSLITEGIYEKRTGTGVFTSGVKHQQAYTENQYRGTINANVSMIQAESYLYAEYLFKRGKWTFMSNLAGERFYFSQKKNTTERFALLPAARITFAPNNDWNFRYGINLQNTIPSLAYLNDVEQQIDPLQVRRGNPDLKSFETLSQKLNVVFHKKLISFDLQFGYHYEINPVMESVFYENGLFVRTYENQRNFQTMSAEPTIQLKPWKNYLSILVAPRFAHYVSNGNNYSHTFNLSTLRVQIDGNYKNWLGMMMLQTPPFGNYFYGEQSAKSTLVSVFALGYRQNSWSVLAGAMNPLGFKMKIKGENRAALNPVITDAWNDGMKQKITVRFTYNFNFGKQFKNMNRRLENTDENSGIMSGGKE